MCKHIHTLAHTHTYAHINIFLNWNYSNLPLRWLLLLLLCAKAVRLLIPPVFFLLLLYFCAFCFYPSCLPQTVALWTARHLLCLNFDPQMHRGASNRNLFVFFFLFFVFGPLNSYKAAWSLILLAAHRAHRSRILSLIVCSTRKFIENFCQIM